MDDSKRDAAGVRGYVPLVNVWRGEVVESVHNGAIVVADESGRVHQAHGDPGTVTYLRSAAKPAQVLPLLISGAADRFRFDTAEIAVMIGSHGGEPFHVAAVQSILDKVGLDASALQCGAHPPYHRPSARALREAGAPPTALHNNCSGKHAGMLALAVHLGTAVDRYLEGTHPVQRSILDGIATLSGLPASRIVSAPDGCSAPNYAMPLAAAAGLYARLAEPHSLPREVRAAAARALAAMRQHPDMVAGTDRLCTALMRAGGDGLIAKIGAEGFYSFAYHRQGHGYGVALKVGDGDNERARPAAAIALLHRLGVLPDAAADALRERFAGPLRNHRGILVGRLEPVLALEDPSKSAGARRIPRG